MEKDICIVLAWGGVYVNAMKTYFPDFYELGVSTFGVSF